MSSERLGFRDYHLSLFIFTVLLSFLVFASIMDCARWPVMVVVTHKSSEITAFRHEQPIKRYTITVRNPEDGRETVFLAGEYDFWFRVGEGDQFPGAVNYVGRLKEVDFSSAFKGE